MRARRLLVLLALIAALLLAVGIAGVRPSQAGAQRTTATAHPVAVSTLGFSLTTGRADRPGAALLVHKQTVYVYIAETGTKYHRSGCRYLAHSKIKKTLSWVKSHGYKPCKVCNPPK